MIVDLDLKAVRPWAELIELLRPPEWTTRANCLSRSEDRRNAFVPERKNKIAPVECGACPVRAECAQLGEDTDSEGWWGGHYRATPRASKATYSKVKCGTEAGYQRHQRAGEPTCTDCKAAHSKLTAARRAARAREEEKAA